MKALRTGLALAVVLGLLAPALTAQQEAVAQQQKGVVQQQAGVVQQQEPPQIELTVLGMSCPFCAYGLEKKLKKLEGVEDLEVVLQTGLATITLKDDADISNDLLKKAVKDAGFEVAKITRNFESEFPDFEQKP